MSNGLKKVIIKLTTDVAAKKWRENSTPVDCRQRAVGGNDLYKEFCHLC